MALPGNNSSRSKVKKPPAPENEACKNCGTEFSGHYCPNCGQSKKEFEKPFSFLIIDMAGNIFAFDTRFWKTLMSLLIRPGKFTREYLEGKRARYMAPMRLYIFISFLFFVLLSILVSKNVSVDEESLTRLNDALAEHENQFLADSTHSSDRDTLVLEEFLPGSKILIDKPDKNTAKVMKAVRQISNNPSLYINRLLKFFSWSLFGLMPVYGLLLWLFFFKRRPYYYGHLILSINQHAFAFLLLLILLIFKLAWPGRAITPEIYLAFILPVYVYTGFKTLYGEGYLKTFFKAAGILFIYTLVLLVAVALISVFWIFREFG